MPRSADRSTADEARRSTRDETTKRILDAAEELFATHSPDSVTVRQVAERAGVTHPLVHLYVGSKDDLLNAVLQRTAVDRTESVKQMPALNDALRGLTRQALVDRLHSKALVRSAMDGVEYVSLKDGIETGHALVALAEKTAARGAAPSPPPHDIDSRVVVAAVSALVLGWSATEDWAWPVFGLDPAEKDEVYRQLTEIVTYLGDLVLVSGAEDPPA